MDKIQSMETKEICILVVHDDPMYRNILADLTEYGIYHFEAMAFQNIGNALNIIKKKKDSLNLVVTDVHRSNSNGFQMLQCIEKEIELPIISLCPNEDARKMKYSIGRSRHAKVYFLKSLSVDNFNTLWQQACARERDKYSTYSGSGDDQLESMLQKSEGRETEERDEQNEVSSGDDEHSLDEKKRRREDKNKKNKKKKRRRFKWPGEMHGLFCEAIGQLGYERAFPKKIAELMNIPGLTREHVASHLQKYRKKLAEGKQPTGSTTSSTHGINFKTSVKETSLFPSIHSALHFNPPQRNPLQVHHKPQHSNFTLYPKTHSNISMPPSSYNYNEASTSTISNLGSYEHFFTKASHQYPHLLHFGTPQTYSRTNSAQVESSPNTGSCTYIGFRLTGNGMSVETGQTAVSNNDVGGDNVNLSTEGEGSENLYIPQQQPSLPPVMPSIQPHEFETLEFDAEMDALLAAAGSTSPPIFWKDDFDNNLF